ncbi:CHASE2 domain-containing protein [Undibacterium cyanobacteriorum]|uniref:histidine kinase n=1 Tax=Undibacterium cyanobacteriorum TaxID=3073561 RepID=A0ABY9RIW8_9BURK|nr:CHASE2 domain-containing protein [Undibacterium sp. 20NA77.5]WMW81171.1 CHASE2 domain-containing protein [Undibacterium sp. 20NA77.5]
MNDASKAKAVAHQTTAVPHLRLGLRDCLMLAIILILINAFLIYSNSLKRFDQSLYDKLLQVQTHRAHDDIVIVAIDDYSLKEIGKWPWNRQIHAQLLERLQAAKPKAIGFDVVFTEAQPGNSNGIISSSSDEAFANALKASGKVVLPMTSLEAGRGLQAELPLPLFANASRAVGHNHIELDDDGVARSVFLREGTQGQWWSHFVLELYKVGRTTQADKSIQSANDAAPVSVDHFSGAFSTDPGIWHRDWRFLIPYYGGSGHFKSIPYVAVLKGEVSAQVFQNKYVLIGATAQGMADAFPTPVTSNQGLLAGVEVNANILASLLDHRSILQAPAWQLWLVSSAVLCLSLFSFVLFSPRVALIIGASMVVLSLITSVVLLRFGLWLPPASTVVVLVLSYPLWSWRRLETAIDFLGQEFIRLDQEPHLLPELNPDMTIKDRHLTIAKNEIQDKLDRHIRAMQSAAQRVRDLRQFVTDSLYSLPDATLVTTVDGNVVLGNPAAAAYFNSIGMPHVIDTLVPYLFSNMSQPHTEYIVQPQKFSWWHILDLDQTELLSKGVEVEDPKGRDLIIKSAPCYTSEKVLIGWIISIIDISEIRQAERRRDEMLHFISHDMRAPQASILALIEMQKNPETAIDHQEFLKRIEKSSNTTLALADSFVHLAHAESSEYRFLEHDFQDLLLDATEEMWSLAHNKRITIKTDIPEGEYPVRVDRSLMTRALTNLLSNAIKYSPSDTTISCSLQAVTRSLSDYVICTIQDQGYGIARADQSRLFQRFQRLSFGKGADQIKNDGVGLGMVFVKTVIDRHHANIRFHSVPGQGTSFTIEVPMNQF